MQPTHLNFLAVIVAAVVNMAIGFAWFSPLLFSKLWQQIMEVDPADTARNEAAKKGMGPLFGLVFVGAFLTSYMMARLLGWMEQDTWLGGMRVGFYLWIGLIMPVTFQFAVFSGKPMGLRMKMFVVQASHYLVVFVATGALLGAWH
ncbi:MAG: DUF1761 domain-containing protein [Pseudomonadota bacterium]